LHAVLERASESIENEGELNTLEKKRRNKVKEEVEQKLSKKQKAVLAAAGLKILKKKDK